MESILHFYLMFWRVSVAHSIILFAEMACFLLSHSVSVVYLPPESTSELHFHFLSPSFPNSVECSHRIFLFSLVSLTLARHAFWRLPKVSSLSCQCCSWSCCCFLFPLSHYGDSDYRVCMLTYTNECTFFSLTRYFPCLDFARVLTLLVVKWKVESKALNVRVKQFFPVIKSERGISSLLTSVASHAPPSHSTIGIPYLHFFSHIQIHRSV